jgi:hypothetical protein
MPSARDGSARGVSGGREGCATSATPTKPRRRRSQTRSECSFLFVVSPCAHLRGLIVGDAAARESRSGSDCLEKCCRRRDVG